MNKKIKNYIDVLFSEVPRSRKAAELKEELMSNMNDRFEDYIREGKTETQAYSLTVANMGEIDDMIKEVMPDADFKKEAQFYRKRNARNTAIGVMLYILGAACVVTGGLFEQESLQIASVIVLLVLAAIATGLIVYSHMSTPQEYKDYDEQTEQERRIYNSPNGATYKSIMSIYWSVMTIAYLAISFLTGAWHISWIIWPLAGVLSGIVTTIFELRNTHEQ